MVLAPFSYSARLHDVIRYYTKLYAIHEADLDDGDEVKEPASKSSARTAVFLHRIRVTSNRESGTILNELGPDISKRIASGSLGVVCFCELGP